MIAVGLIIWCLFGVYNYGAGFAYLNHNGELVTKMRISTGAHLFICGPLMTIALVFLGMHRFGVKFK